MSNSTEQLKNALKQYEPAETIFVSASRAFGRRVLTTLARETMLVGVRAETPLTLAVELCADALADERVCRSIDEVEAAELVFQCMKTSQLFGKGKAFCLATAKELYGVFGELDAACVDRIGGSDKLDEVQRLREAYAQRKGELLLDRMDLLRRAREKAALGSDPLCRAHYVVLGSYRPSELERQLVNALSENGARLTVVPVDAPEGETLPAGGWEMTTPKIDPLAGKQLSVVRCRGVETEADHIFRDLLRCGESISADDCAIVYLSGEYAPLLFETAARYGVPVTMGAGIPFTASPLYYLLDRISALAESGYDAELMCDLLSCSALRIAGKRKLASLLDTLQIGHGRDRYRLLWESDNNKVTTEDKKAWESFFEVLLSLTEPEKLDLTAQKAALMSFLGEYVSHISAEQVAAFCRVRTTVSQIASLLPGERLLDRTMELLKTAAYRAEGAAPGAVFCTTLTQALFTGRKKLYICGLSRYSLDTAGKETACFLDEERERFQGTNPTLRTTALRAQERSYRFWELLANHEGEIVLSYSDFDITRKSELSPAPAFRTAARHLGFASQKDVPAVSYVPEAKLSAWDHLIGSGMPLSLAMPIPDTSCAAARTEKTEEKTQSEEVEEMTFSASSLETALRCPFKFYVQHMLHVYEPAKTKRGEAAWLLPTELGTFCHEVLERYYSTDPLPADDTQIFEEAWEQLEKRYPPVARWMMERDKRRARAMIGAAVTWTERERRKVLSTEEKFGPERDEAGAITRDFKITVGQTPIRLTGSIDRVDECADGSYAIVDYKTSNPERFREEIASNLHLQHYLYTLAEEALHPERKVDEAGYLLLAANDGECYAEERGAACRAEAAKRTEALIRILSDEEKAQTCAPCYRLDGEELKPGSAEERGDQWSSCRRYCGFAALCPIHGKEDFGCP